MRKTALLASSFALFLSSIQPSASASAASTAFKLTIDNRAIAFADAQPYKIGTDVMLPLRQTAQALGLKVEYRPASKEAAISGSATSATVKAGSDLAQLGGETSVKIGAEAVVKSNRLFVPLSFFENAFGLRTAVHDDSATASIFTSAQNEEAVRAIAELLVSGEHQKLSDLYFDDSMKKALPAETLKSTWAQLSATLGEFTGIQKIQANPEAKDNREFAVLLSFSKAQAVLTLSLNANNQVSGLFIKPLATQTPTPDQLIEEEVIVGAGTKYPLPGTLTLPKNATGPLPAVVLVHGSGPNDRDETIGSAKPFRDLAWGLAEQGIAVLRYDKRTYAHGKSFTPDMLASFTVKDETVDDAIAAAKLLKSDKRIDASKVYVVGHSLGGMLAPRIDADGGDFAGLAILAGSPRKLWEIIADQNEAVLATLDDGNPAKAAGKAFVADELEKARKLAALTDEEAKAQTLFTVPAYYFKEMDSRDTAGIAAKLTKPLFILQGEADTQAYADKDYVQWQEVLKGHKNAEFKLYPGLNHLFGKVKDASGKVDPQVIQDLADWILNR